MSQFDWMIGNTWLSKQIESAMPGIIGGNSASCLQEANTTNMRKKIAVSIGSKNIFLLFIQFWL